MMSDECWRTFRVFFLAFAVALFFVSMALSDEGEPVEPAVKVCATANCAGGHGSGFQLYDGYFLTAAHVIGARDQLYLRNSRGQTQVAKAIWVSKTSDWGLLHAKGAAFLEIPETTLGCDAIGVGARVTSIGNPADMLFAHVEGRVATKPQDMGLWKKAIALDIVGYRGMSGGPVFNEAGRIVGAIVGTLSGSGLAVMEPVSKICNVLPARM